jgi:predicted transcriptional regulator
MSSVKNTLREIADELPEECSWDDVMYRIYVRQQIEAGITDVDAGNVVSHEEVFSKFREAGDK